MSRICQSKENYNKYKNLKKEIKKQKKANLEDSDGVQMPCKLMLTGVKKCIDILQKHLKKQNTLVK